jgi:heptosyltransferase-2
MGPRKWLAVRTAEALCRIFVRSNNALEPLAADRNARIRILVIEYWQLGDLAIAVPCLQTLRRAFPNAHISLLLNEALQRFLQGQGLVDEFIPIRVPWTEHLSRWKKYNPFSSLWIPFVRTILSLRAHKFDFAFSGRMDFRDNFLLWMSGATRRVGYGFAGGSCFLTDIVSPDISRPHRADLWLQLLESFASTPQHNQVAFKIEDEMRQQAADFLRSLNLEDNTFVIGIHPGARSPIRRWGDDKFAEVARNLLQEAKATVLWFTEPGSPSPSFSNSRCHTVAVGFPKFLALLERCQLLICNDSGPMHLANLLQVPVVAVFGPQNPAWFGPRGTQDRVVIRPEMWCRPCFDYCIFDQPYCLRAIAPEQTIATVKDALVDIRNDSFDATIDRSRTAVASGERGNHG